ncbi:hypothetical protein AN641_04840 [Candidatus Epulonipiscioides gigas]|nr:hypothetical protein AN641_04840 [Epulopiscium sp. SCG-C07WGA-EpuloA2]
MTFDKVKEIISNNLNIPISKIKLKSRLLHDFNADSLDLYQIVMNIEMDFDFEIDEKDIYKIKRVQDIVFIIDDKLSTDIDKKTENF